MSFSPQNSKFDLELVIPQLELDGLYQLSGQLLVIPLKGSGKFHIQIYGMKLFINIVTSKFIKNSQTYLQVDEMSLDYSIKNAKSKIEEQHSKDFCEFFYRDYFVYLLDLFLFI
jgi:hypothetical protein